MARWRRVPVLMLGVLVLSSVVVTAGPATAAGPPSIRVFASSSTITVERGRKDFVNVDPGIWMTSVGGAFELRATRDDYDSPIVLEQTDAATGAPLRELPADLLDGWWGLGDFLHVSVGHAQDRPVVRYPMTFCPNTWYRQRLNDDGPINSRYPYFCGGSFFTRGMVWGIDDGWAVPAVDGYYYGFGWKAERDHYTIRVWIDPAYRDLLGISDADAETLVKVTVVDSGTQPAARVARPHLRAEQTASVPDVTSPDPATLPDLVALPAWGMTTYHRKGHDYLSFNATEWNAGPGTMVVEGFRQPDVATMDAYQYFYSGGAPVGRASVGTFEYHAGGGHDHWHFEQFTQYSLLDASGEQVVLSDKQSWCLANTDAIDLAAPNANWTAWSADLATSCGGPSALWVREVLDTGWGDTYSQWVAGQAFDITDLPNGTYNVRVQVNPLGAMYEGSTTNDIQDRVIYLKGDPGDRRVKVPPWHGIDTDGGCCYRPLG